MLALYVGNLIIIEHNIVRPIKCVRLLIRYLFLALAQSLRTAQIQAHNFHRSDFSLRHNFRQHRALFNLNGMVLIDAT